MTNEDLFHLMLKLTMKFFMKFFSHKYESSSIKKFEPEKVYKDQPNPTKI